MGFLGIGISVAVVVVLIVLIGQYKKNNNADSNSDDTTNFEGNKSEKSTYTSIPNSAKFFQDEIFLGTIYINDQPKDLIARMEDDRYIYYLDGEIIGAYDPDVMGDNLIVFRENSLKNELSAQIKDEIEQILEKAKEKEEEEKKRKLELEEKVREQNVYERELGYQRSFVRDTKAEKQKEVEEQQKKREKVLDKTLEMQLKSKQPKIENKAKDINIKQEVDMETMATDMDTIGKRLEEAGKIKGKEKEGTLAFVESDDLDKLKDEKGNRLHGHMSRYEAVVVDKKGNVRALGLENDTQEGNDPQERNYQVKQNKNENVEKGDVLTRLQIQGRETIGIEKGQYGEVEVYHSQNKTIGGEGVEGNKSLDRQLETSNAKNAIEGPDEGMQKLAQKYQDGYRSVEMAYQEAEQHENAEGEPCEELEVEDLDGDPNTVSHNHTDDIVAKLMKNGEINDKFTEREVRQMVENAWGRKDENTSVEEFEKNIENDIEADAQNMRGERGR